LLKVGRQSQSANAARVLSVRFVRCHLRSDHPSASAAGSQLPRPASVILKRGAPSQCPRAYCVASSPCPALSIGATGGSRYSPELRGARYMIPSFVQQPSNVKCPHCPRCQGRMVLARIRASSICEKRSFDCPYCNFIETQIVDDPVRTDALVRLANSIRPPT
jgi:hypothetical protein